MSIAICTMGMFWPQGGGSTHGLKGRNGKFGIDGYGQPFNFQEEKLKIRLHKVAEKNLSENILKIELKED